MLSEKDIRRNRRILTDRDCEFAATLKIVGDINRFRIFRILMEVPLISVSSVAGILEISMPLTSQHVKALAGAKLLTKNRSGKVVYLQLDLRNPIVEDLVRSIRRGARAKPVKKITT